MRSENAGHEQGGKGSGEHGGNDNKKVKVAISTTAGFHPAEGFDSVPLNQKVEVQLGKAAKALEITSTNNWIATVTEQSGKRSIVVTNTYSQNNLAGEVTIDWGPSEGGGGASRRG